MPRDTRLTRSMTAEFFSDDYKICAVIMQQCVYQTKIRDVDELRQRLLNVCHNIEQESVRPRWPYDMRPSVRAEKYIRDANG